MRRFRLWYTPVPWAWWIWMIDPSIRPVNPWLMLATCGVLLRRADWPFTGDDLCEQAAWWLGPGALPNEPNRGRPLESASFRNAGLVVLASGPVQVLFDGGPFGRGSGAAAPSSPSDSRWEPAAVGCSASGSRKGWRSPSWQRRSAP